MAAAFATVPAYLADMFGTQYVGAIHGRLLTAWSTAGVIGPILITQIPEAQIRSGVPREARLCADALHPGGFLAVGFVCNLLVRPVAARWFMRRPAPSAAGSAVATSGSFGIGRGGFSSARAAGLGGGRHAAALGRLDHLDQGLSDFQVGDMAQIGFIGLGNMGLPMAVNLVRAGHAVRGFDLAEAARARLAEAGGQVAASVPDAVAGCETVITMLPAGQHVRAVLAGQAACSSTRRRARW